MGVNRRLPQELSQLRTRRAGQEETLWQKRLGVQDRTSRRRAVYSTGAEIQFADREEIDKVVEQCRPSDFGLRTIIRQVIKSKLFLNK